MQNERIKILLIEDTPVDAELIGEMLAESRREKFSVEHVQYLADALALLKSRSFDCILVDLSLPDSHGLESALAVRGQAKQTPIIILTVLDDEELARKALRSDIQDYLVKGEISGALLIRSIRYALQRKQKEEELHLSEARYRALYQDNPAMILTLDTDGRIISVNRACTTKLGFTEDEFKGRSVLNFFHEDDRTAVVEQLRNCVTYPEKVHQWQFRKVGKDGSPVWVEELAQAVYDLNGSLNILVVCQDITDHVKLEDALRKSERKFQKVFHAVPALVAISTIKDGKFFNVNETCERVLGYRQDEMVGRTSLELGIWKSRADRNRIVRILEKLGSVRDLEVSFRNKTGQTHTGLFNAEFIDLNGDHYMLSLLLDITERKRLEEEVEKLNRELMVHSAELERINQDLQTHKFELETQNEELRRAQEEADALRGRYQDLYDFAPIGYCTLDEKGAVMEANLHGASFLSMEKGNLMSYPFSLLLGREWQLEFKQFLHRVFSGEAQERCEVRIVTGGAESRWVLIEGVKASSGEKERKTCRVALIDITERKSLEEEIMRMNEELAGRAAELEAANKDLEAFNYTVAHDLRRPLTNINGYCQIIEELCGNLLDETCLGYLRETYNGTLIMNQHITALLNFSHLAHTEPRREMVDLSSLADSVAAEMALGQPGRRAAFQIVPGITAIGDERLLRLVLENLLGNAWKYTAKCENAIIEFGVKEEKGKPVYFVRDNGSGFAMADAERIFSPFQRLPGAEEYKGFGIGLATVERIIKRHGGSVWAESKPGRGAAFYFTLPEACGRTP